MSRNIHNMRHKVRNGQNLSHESPNFTNYFFQSDLTYNLSHFSTSLRPHYQNSFFSKYFFLFSILNSRMTKNMCIWHHKLCNSKTGVGPTFTWSNEPWFNWLIQSLQCIESYFSHKTIILTFFRRFLILKGIKIAVLFEKLWLFCWIGRLCLLFEFHPEGSVPEACAAGWCLPW